MVEAAVAGGRSDGLEGVDVVTIAALELTTPDVLGADGYLLVTPANLGYMSGALKHAFDTVYADALDVTRGRPFAALVHGESDTTGALRSIEMVTTGLEWRLAAPMVSIIGPATDNDLAVCREAGAVVAALTLRA